MAIRYMAALRKIWPVLVVVVAVAATLIAGSLSSWFGVLPPGPPPAVVNATLVVGATTGYESSTFWAVNAQSPAIEDPTLAALVNDTPLTVFRFGPNGEATNQSAGLTYSPNGTPSVVIGENDPEFVTWCEWIRCRAIMMVPAEIDNVSVAVATVRYVEQTLGFHPEYWSIGNEPETWTHFGIPWAAWTYSDDSRPTPMQYADEVQRYVTALRAFDSTIRIIGIQASTAQPSELAWLTDVVAVNGPNLTAIAYHAYPGGEGTPSGSLGDFFASLNQPTGFPLNYPGAVAAVRSACPSCDLPVLVDEYNAAAPNSTFGRFLNSYAEVPYIGAGIVEALRENVTQVAFFDLQASVTTSEYGMLGPALDVRPVFKLYSVFFENMPIGRVVNTSLLGAPSGVYSVMSQNATATSLLVVDTNLATGLRLNLTASGLPTSGTWISSVWGPTQTDPQSHSMAPDPSGSWYVPAEGIFLLTAVAD
jgi:hypothetical protein